MVRHRPSLNGHPVHGHKVFGYRAEWSYSLRDHVRLEMYLLCLKGLYIAANIDFSLCVNKGLYHAWSLLFRLIVKANRLVTHPPNPILTPQNLRVRLTLNKGYNPGYKYMS